MIFNIENFNVAGEDMHQLQKYFRIILLVWVDNFCLLSEMIWEKKWKSFHPTHYAERRSLSDSKCWTQLWAIDIETFWADMIWQVNCFINIHKWFFRVFLLINRLIKNCTYLITCNILLLTDVDFSGILYEFSMQVTYIVIWICSRILELFPLKVMNH